MAKVYLTTRVYKGVERSIYRAEWRDSRKRGNDKRRYKDFRIEGSRREAERKAQAWAKRKEREVEQGIVTDSTATLQKVCEEWLHRHGRNLRTGSRKNYEMVARNHFYTDEIADLPLADVIEPGVLQDCWDRVADKGLKGIPIRINTILHGAFCARPETIDRWLREQEAQAQGEGGR
jgi:hypothetical protein